LDGAKKCFLGCSAQSCSLQRTPTSPQEQKQSYSAGETNKDIRIGVYLNIQSDCTSGPLPTIRLVEPPAHGKVTLKKANFSATNYKQCLALNVPAYVSFYRSERIFLGNDGVLLEVRDPGENKNCNISL